MVQDNFNRCFSVSQEPAWNWNFYLAPMWLMGVIIRYALLLPLRFTFIIVCSVQDPSPPLPPSKLCERNTRVNPLQALFIVGCELVHLLPLSQPSKASALRWYSTPNFTTDYP